MPIIKDDEFGEIVVRRSAKATTVTLRMAPNGKIRISMPVYAPLFLAKQLIKNSRNDIRRVYEEHNNKIVYTHGMQVGKSHRIEVRNVASRDSLVIRKSLIIAVYLSETDRIDDKHIQQAIKDEIAKSLRLEAKSYLPRRLKYLAEKGDFRYTALRFSHSGGRWGSCNSQGTISLNIGLMKLPFELIDYVLVHELAHTIEMNHSADFWEIVEKFDPHYRVHKKMLKAHSPSI